MNIAKVALRVFCAFSEDMTSQHELDYMITFTNEKIKS